MQFMWNITNVKYRIKVINTSCTDDIISLGKFLKKIKIPSKSYETFRQFNNMFRSTDANPVKTSLLIINYFHVEVNEPYEKIIFNHTEEKITERSARFGQSWNTIPL